MVVKKLAQQRIEALHAFVEQQGWQQTEALPPPFAPHPLKRRSIVINDGETSVTVSVAFEGGLDLRGDDGKLKTMLLEWIRQMQPKAMVLSRELRSYQSSTTKPGGKAWKFDRNGITLCHVAKSPVRLGLSSSTLAGYLKDFATFLPS